jgi:O-antigen/teichoic acid export membrane protein
LWVLVGSVAAYGTLLDLGLTNAIIKYVAEYRARGEPEQARHLVATAVCLYSALGLVAIVLSALLAPWFPELFHIPAPEHDTAVWLTVLTGTAVGLAPPCCGGCIGSTCRTCW